MKNREITLYRVKKTGEIGVLMDRRNDERLTLFFNSSLMHRHYNADELDIVPIINLDLKEFFKKTDDILNQDIEAFSKEKLITILLDQAVAFNDALNQLGKQEGATIILFNEIVEKEVIKPKVKSPRAKFNPLAYALIKEDNGSQAKEDIAHLNDEDEFIVNEERFVNEKRFINKEDLESFLKDIYVTKNKSENG